jgi:cytochrome d ubiquinol oxidase subunit II
MFPFIMPSSSAPGSSITVWDGSSSHLTLQIMLIATAIFMPIVVAYTSWVFRVLRGPVTEEEVSSNHQAY